MSNKLFSHSLECIKYNENTCLEFCICLNCPCHYCQYTKNTTYRKKYINDYFKKHEGLFE